MIYIYKCSCGNIEKKNLSISDRDILIPCSCGKDMARVFNTGDVNFSLKGWGWTGQDYKEKRVRAKRSVEMALKQHERYGEGPKLIPNYNGQEAKSWEDVRDQAVSEKGSDSAALYRDLIGKEKSGPKSKSDVVAKVTSEIGSI